MIERAPGRTSLAGPAGRACGARSPDAAAAAATRGRRADRAAARFAAADDARARCRRRSSPPHQGRDLARRTLPCPSARRHGYASGAGPTGSDIGYPRYEPSPDAADDLQLRPNRRPLFIGLGLALIGLIVLVAMALGGGDDGDEVAREQPIRIDQGSEPTTGPGAEPGSGSSSSGSAAVVDPGNEGTSEPAVGSGSGSGSADVALEAGSNAVEVPTSITINVVSDPPGADVILAGKVIGTTNLKREIERGTGLSMITVHKAGFVDVSKQIDLREDFSSELILKPVEVEPTPPDKKTGTTTKQGGTDDQAGWHHDQAGWHHDHHEEDRRHGRYRCGLGHQRDDDHHHHHQEEAGLPAAGSTTTRSTRARSASSGARRRPGYTRISGTSPRDAQRRARSPSTISSVDTPGARSRSTRPLGVDVDHREVGDDRVHAGDAGQRQRALGQDLRRAVLGRVLHHHDHAAAAGDEIHRAAHALDHLAGDHPVREVAARARPPSRRAR